VTLNKFGACLSASSQFICVTDDSGTFCTASEPLGEPFEFILRSKNPKDISVGISHLCMSSRAYPFDSIKSVKPFQSFLLKIKSLLL